MSAEEQARRAVADAVFSTIVDDAVADAVISAGVGHALKARRGGKSQLLSKKRPPIRSVTLPVSDTRDEAATFDLIGLTPLEMSEINKRCLMTVPDPDRPGETKVEWDGSKRQFYMVAKALLDEDGKRMYPGETGYVLGAEQVGSQCSNAEIEALFEAVQIASGLDKKARDAVGKDSARTLTTG